MDQDSNDTTFMKLALSLAHSAAEQGEVPVGAIVTIGKVIIAEGMNNPIGCHDPTAHAEIIALRKAARKIGNYRLPGTTLYVTLEPCIMCMGAIIHSRLDRVVFGAFDPKTGAAGSRYSIGRDGLLNHHLEITGGVCETECSALLKAFFQARRKNL
ncbi:MAG: tRNA adenosine(34) deaminase TadA [Proteobacteria bacterium]|nr:tRNA adenosine(34) deaminase TadA [Pseudomonadota bacterium]MBU1058007.1 tRNA adenosine(34) deaminase TadA [Pseudomonadota bacterium]